MSAPWTMSSESASLHRGGETVTLVEGSSFVLSHGSGDFQRAQPLGLFCFDTRVLSDWILLIGGDPIEPLATIDDGPFAATHVGRSRMPGTADSPLTVLRSRQVGRGMCETVEIRNHGSRTVEVQVGLVIGSDFASLFDVKAAREPVHVPVTTRWERASLTLERDEGPMVTATTVIFDPEPDATGERLGWHVAIDAGCSWMLRCEVGVVADGQFTHPVHHEDEALDSTAVARRERWRSKMPVFSTNHEVLGRAIERSTKDLGALRIFDPDRPDRVAIAAGAPWFMALFGRDSLLTSWMTLLVDQDLALGVLQTLAETQGRAINTQSEEEPGRILHEIRSDPSAAELLGGNNTYFGTVDATPLFVMLAGELLRWSGRVDHIEPLLPAVDRALQWIDDFGDRHGLGFVSYERTNDSGLENQGWKDSWDGLRYGDGRIAAAPIALAEVQAYVYGARIARADIAAAMGDHDRARVERRAAAEWQRRFHDAFWLPERGFYAVGLDGDGNPIDSLASNVGHCLWAGVVPEDVAPMLADHLCGPDLCSGWGVRTLAASNPGFNPVSYHCGSVWPHDTALAIAGLARYDFDDHAHQLTDALLDCSAHSAGRLPELFAGFDRADLAAPIPYPTSCSPQAWSAASPLLLVRSMLGLQPDIPRGRIRLRPRLPAGIHRLHATGIPIGGERVTIDIVDGRLQCSGLPREVTLEVA